MEQFTPRVEKQDTEESGLEIPSFSAPAAALLAVLAAGPTDAMAAEQKGLVGQAFNAAQQQIEKGKPSPFGQLLGQVMRELDKRGVAKQADEVIAKSIPIAIDEIQKNMGTLNKGLDAELRRRGLIKE